MANDYRNGPLVTTTVGRQVWSYTAYLEECYAACGERSTKVLDAANAEWDQGKKDIRNVIKTLKRKT
jgi:hypothetical protein